MPDNTRLPIGTQDGDTYASDEIAGIKHQRVKVEYGTDGNATDVSSGNPLPVVDAAAEASLAIIDDLPLSQGSTTLGQKGALVLGAVTTGAPAYTNAQTSPLSLDTTGALRITGAAGTTQYAQGTVATSTDSLAMVGAIRRDTAALDAGVADGDRAAVAVNSAGALWTALATAVPAGNNNIGDVDAISAGDVAHDGIDSGNPVKIGAQAIAIGAAPTAVAAADRTQLYANRHGVLWVQPGHPNTVTVRANYTTAQTDAAIITQGAGGKIVVTQISVAADNANTVDAAVLIGFGTATTPTTTGVVFAHPGVPSAAYLSRGDGSGILGMGADNEDLRITSEVPTGGSIDVVVTYYVLPS